MSELPAPETDDPSEQDHGELFRPSLRHLPPSPMSPRNRHALWTLLTAAAAAVALVAIIR